MVEWRFMTNISRLPIMITGPGDYDTGLPEHGHWGAQPLDIDESGDRDCLNTC